MTGTKLTVRQNARSYMKDGRKTKHTHTHTHKSKGVREQKMLKIVEPPMEHRFNLAR